MSDESRETTGTGLLPMLDRLRDYQPEPRRVEEESKPSDPEPKRLLGELSRASQSLSEVLDALVTEKRDLLSRVATLEAEVERTQSELASARQNSAVEIERTKHVAATTSTFAALDAARQRARATLAEDLLTAIGRERHTSVFCVNVGLLERGRVSRQILREAVRCGVQVRLSSHGAWLSSLLLVEAEGSAMQLHDFLVWARQQLAGADFREDPVARPVAQLEPAGEPSPAGDAVQTS
jgi:hypothetical protein